MEPLCQRSRNMWMFTGKTATNSNSNPNPAIRLVLGIKIPIPPASSKTPLSRIIAIGYGIYGGMAWT